jgi:hypothetical protein
MEAFTLADGPDDDTIAAMKQVYLTASTRNARAKSVMGKLPACHKLPGMNLMNALVLVPLLTSLSVKPQVKFLSSA